MCAWLLSLQSYIQKETPRCRHMLLLLVSEEKNIRVSPCKILNKKFGKQVANMKDEASLQFHQHSFPLFLCFLPIHLSPCFNHFLHSSPNFSFFPLFMICSIPPIQSQISLPLNETSWRQFCYPVCQNSNVSSDAVPCCCCSG